LFSRLRNRIGWNARPVDPDDDVAPILCSACFEDEGLRLDAQRLGRASKGRCGHCGSTAGAKLTRLALRHLAHRFFVVGSLRKAEFGGAPVIEFNDRRQSDIDQGKRHSKDAALIGAAAGIGFFYYGPPLWRFGMTEPLEALQKPSQRASIIRRIVEEYPTAIWNRSDKFYRLRKGDFPTADPLQYDSPPRNLSGTGRLDTKRLPILYGSPDLEVCVHECRIAAEDDVYFATIEPVKDIKLLDLTALLREEHLSPFESLDLAVHLLFLAGRHSYSITRAITAQAKANGFDGILFPSYFSLLRTGAPFLESAFGIPTRRFESAADYERSKIVPNVALFGRPIRDGRVTVSSLNRLYLRRVAYDIGFGPVET
jgi:hypothetical protein